MPSEETAPPTSPQKTSPSERRLRRSAGINTAFRAIKAQHSSNRSAMEVLADRMIGFASATPFLVIHAIGFVLWIYWNLPFSGLPKFDPYPYGMLTTIVSLEAIFLSIFVLMTQSRESRIGELREELTLQVNLRMEEDAAPRGRTLLAPQPAAGGRSGSARHAGAARSQEDGDGSHGPDQRVDAGIQTPKAQRPFEARRLGPSSPNELPQHVRQDAAMPVVADLLRRIDPRHGVKLLLHAVRSPSPHRK